MPRPRLRFGFCISLVKLVVMGKSSRALSTAPVQAPFVCHLSVTRSIMERWHNLPPLCSSIGLAPTLLPRLQWQKETTFWAAINSVKGPSIFT